MQQQALFNTLLKIRFLFRKILQIKLVILKPERDFNHKSVSFRQHVIFKHTIEWNDSLIHKSYIFPSPATDLTILDSFQNFNKQYFAFTDKSAISGDNLTKLQ